MEYLRAWGTLIHEKNLKSKISCQTPLKGAIARNGFLAIVIQDSLRFVSPGVFSLDSFRLFRDDFVYCKLRFNMELDLQCLFDLHVTWFAQLYSFAETPLNPHLDLIYSYEGAIGQPRQTTSPCNPLTTNNPKFAVFSKYI